MPPSPLIAVDIGNSTTKIGWFAEQFTQPLPTPVATRLFSTPQVPPDALANELPPSPARWHISSVHRGGTQSVRVWIADNRPNDEVKLLTRDDLPIQIAVDLPDKVGVDRLAAAVAANALRDPTRPAIVVGAGSAITVNLVTADGAFAGGAILPGFKMQADALYGGADLLPLALLAPDADPPPIVGRNTEDAIRSGLFWGAVGSVREIVARLSGEFPVTPDVFVTGGDLRRLAQHIGAGARFVPNLVLSGIALAAD